MTVYLIRTPVEGPQPRVFYDSPRNRGIDWGYLEEVLDASVPPDPERLAAIDVYAASTRPFDTVWMANRVLVSDRLRKVLEPACQGDAEFLPLSVNGSPFFGLVIRNVLDVLDRQRSELEYFPSAPDRVMSIRRYAFKDLGSTRAFKIPETPTRKFATEPVRQAYLASGIPGLRFVDCENPPPDEGLG